MGKRNREKRAAKAEQRARGRTRPAAMRDDSDADGFEEHSGEQAYSRKPSHAFRSAVRAAAQAHVLRGSAVAAELVEDLSAWCRAIGVREAHLALDQILLDEVRQIWK